MVFLENDSKRACDKVLAYKLFDPNKHRLDLGYYFNKFQSPFKKILEHVLTKNELKLVFIKATYEESFQSVACFTEATKQDVVVEAIKEKRTAAMDEDDRKKKRRKKVVSADISELFEGKVIPQRKAEKKPEPPPKPPPVKSQDISKWLTR
jgi:hypothetical protein